LAAGKEQNDEGAKQRSVGLSQLLTFCRDEELGNQAKESIGSDRVSVLKLDVSDDASVIAAADEIKRNGIKLTAICNNAGIGFGKGFEDTINVNYLGTRRVCDAFIPLLADDGRVVNTASASGPNFVSGLSSESVKKIWISPDTTMEELTSKVVSTMSLTDYDNQAYGFSKAAVNVYTRLLAEKHRGKFVVNSQTPGWIATDLTKGMGATNPPEKGVKAAMKLLFDELRPDQTGYYFGSDGLRSPLDVYRAPGDPEFEG